jgi:hypothetical protein
VEKCGENSFNYLKNKNLKNFLKIKKIIIFFHNLEKVSGGDRLHVSISDE